MLQATNSESQLYRGRIQSKTPATVGSTVATIVFYLTLIVPPTVALAKTIVAEVKSMEVIIFNFGLTSPLEEPSEAAVVFYCSFQSRRRLDRCSYCRLSKSDERSTCYLSPDLHFESAPPLESFFDLIVSLTFVFLKIVGVMCFLEDKDIH
ncbi:hypothetical protein PIB30_036578 [Stylosanthes scabra]|uniref:Uncharacterized protein n=1 Tax=Stylosanthes scabra TaxID=79078 RepID=A0ABU6YC84_9FABA|nr:hypothetical protein [Stylosanthes scabra]